MPRLRAAMVFSSQVFLYLFLPAFLAVYALCPARGRSLLITLASFVFYGWWRPDFCWLMAFSAVLDYGCGLAITRDRARGGRGSRWLVCSIGANLGLLAWFKYSNFGVASLNAALLPLGVDPIAWTEVVLPVGISFYTFQTMSYTIDVWRGEVPATKNLIDFLCYVTMFPQLVAGPIVRYRSVADQIIRRDHGLSKVFSGVLLLQCGLTKKLLLADPLGSLADSAFGAPGLGPLDAWIGVIAYAFQIYFDFSGYSDMAIGLGLLMGFRFPVNFNAPYRATSVTDFWRRWHISLSTWLRDYLYVPLGGNRGGRLRTLRNLAVVMILGGLWHGAAWTFVAWGAWQGFWLVVERGFRGNRFGAAVPAPLKTAWTFGLVLLGWVLFRASDLEAAGRYMASLGGLSGGAREILHLRPIHAVTLVAAAGVVWLAPTSQRSLRHRAPLRVVTLQGLFVLALLHLDFQTHVPFLYYRF